MLSRIAEDAQAQAEEIAQRAAEAARQSSDVILSRAKQQCDQLAAKAAAETEDILRRAQLMAGLQARKNSLQLRREMIDEVFADAQTALTQLPDQRAAAFLTALALAGCESGEETLAVSAADMPRFADGELLAAINRALRESGRKGAVTLRAEPAKIAGGLLILGAKSDVNASVETLLRQAREQLERPVADILFGEG